MRSESLQALRFFLLAALTPLSAGIEVVQACLAAKCHYTDTTGEQDWLITLEQEFGTKFGNAGLLLAPITFVHANMGFIGLKAFPAAVVGGFGSLPGAIVGGLVTAFIMLYFVVVVGIAASGWQWAP